MERAYDTWEAMCGHGSLAAVLRLRDVEDVRPFFDRGGWVNIPIMQEAIKRAGRMARLMKKEDFVAGGHCKYFSVILVQWVGPWCSDRMQKCRYRHWVGQRDRRIYDVNLGSWVTKEDWEAWVPEIYPEGAVDFEFYRALVLL